VYPPRVIGQRGGVLPLMDEFKKRKNFQVRLLITASGTELQARNGVATRSSIAPSRAASISRQIKSSNRIRPSAKTSISEESKVTNQDTVIYSRVAFD